jgi:signal transduction histidine kinase
MMQIFKYDIREELMEMSVEGLCMNPERDRNILLEMLAREGWLEQYELECRDRYGNPFTAGLSLRVVQYEGESAVQIILRDITQIKRMEGELRDYSANLERMVEEKTAELREANQKLLGANRQAEAIIEELQTTQAALERSNRELGSANKDLQETREQLAVSAHQSGMAELAVSILHNIGNAVNSVNVRAYSLAESMAHREMELLEKVCDFLESESSGLHGKPFEGEFKKYLLECLHSVIEAGKDIRASSEKDMEFIRKGLDHIMEIIALQQEYAGIRGLETQVDIHRLIEDSIEMLMDSIRKRGIHVETNLLPVPELTINKNKMMQILINIIKNAYEAIDGVPGGDEHMIRVSVFPVKDGERELVQIEVSDTGIGLDPSQCDRVFQFDYSNKGRGTGFGLHDAANYIKAQEGSIRITSGGVGKGADVVIRMPVAAKRAAGQGA